MRRHGHDRAGAVGDEHIVGGPDGDLGTVDGVDGVGAGEHAGLLLVGKVRTLEVGLVADRGDIAFDGLLLGRGGELADERMLGRDDHVGRAVKGVRAGGEDGQRVGMAVQLEGDFGAFGLADPVLLEALGGIGPVDMVEAFDELVGVGGDAQDPLADRATFDRVVASVGARSFGGVEDFLVGEDGAEGWAEPDGLFGDVGEAVTEQLEEDPLRPAEVVLVRRGQFAVPVDGEAEHLQLAAEVIDVTLGLDGGVLARGDRVLLGGQAEGVPAHRVQDVEAVGLLIAGEDVRRGVALRVADVQAGAGGVGEHVQDVVLRLAAGDRLGAEGRVGFPDGLPLLLEGGEIVAAGFCFRSVHECVQIGGSGRRWQGFGASADPIPLA